MSITKSYFFTQKVVHREFFKITFLYTRGMKPKVDDKKTMNSSISRQKVAHGGLF